MKQTVNCRENGWGLLDNEKQLFGERCPKGFTKVSLLGKGGIAVVWLCVDESTKEKVAIKQFPKKSGTHNKGLDHSARVEI